MKKTEVSGYKNIYNPNISMYANIVNWRNNMITIDSSINHWMKNHHHTKNNISLLETKYSQYINDNSIKTCDTMDQIDQMRAKSIINRANEIGTMDENSEAVDPQGPVLECLH